MNDMKPDPALAVESNNAKFLLSMGRAGGGEERDDKSVHWVFGGSPIDYHNAVVRAHLTDDSVVAASREALERLGVPGSWHVGPTMRPLDIGEHLLQGGFTFGGSEPGMAVRRDEWKPPPSTDLKVVAVTDLDDYETVLASGFGEGPIEARWVRTVFDRIGPDVGWQHWVGYVDQLPVATASSFRTDDPNDGTGIYFVCTKPDYRRRGYGAAITYAAGKSEQLTVLCSSDVGRSVYSRLGFKEVCAIDLYEWHADR